MSLFWISAVLVIALTVKAEVIVENNGYSNVLISFSQNVQTDRNQELLENFKISLKEASEVLQSAVGLRFSKVTIVVPQSWNISGWNIEVGDYTEGSGVRSDIIINGINDNAFGKLPYAEQYGDCSTPGRQVIVPEEFLLNQNSFRKGQILAREWLKYRYGVFDENGYVGDPIYPLFYSLPGVESNSISVTGCTNTPVEYKLIGRDGNNCSLNDETMRHLVAGDCFIEPTEESIENVTSSLMFMQEKLQNMQHICGKEEEYQHSSTSQNKHNAFCNGQSIWDVIRTSSDFSNEASATEGDIEYTYVREQRLKVVISWEYTQKMQSKGKTILTVIKKFIYDLPNGSKYAAFPFTDELIDKRDYSLKELEDWPNDRAIQLASEFVKPVNGCIDCAIQKAIEILSSDSQQSKPEGTVIIIASSNVDVQEELIQKIKSSNLCFMFLVFSDDTQQDQLNSYASASNCGSVVNLGNTDNELETFKLLFAAMESVLPTTTEDSVTETVQTSYYVPPEPMTIKIDNTMQKVTIWVLEGKESDYMEFKFNDNMQPMTQEVSSEIMAFSFHPSEEGVLTFKYLYGTDHILIQVRVTSKPGQYINGDVFIRDTTSKDSTQQMPVILYAKIGFGWYPVQNADVSAIVTNPGGESVDLGAMFDDGVGDPDITKDDGIYSRYFTGFSEEGDYIVTITVKSKDQKSTYGKILNPKGYQTCCGSFVERGSSAFILPEFTKTFTTSFHAVSGRPESGYKPSRILDLRISEVNDTKIILKWTAPGAEADSGTVSKYQLKLLCEEENTTECDFNKTAAVLTNPQFVNYGAEVNATIQLLTKTKPVSLGIISFNSQNQMSDLSNILTIILTPDIIELTTANPGTEDLKKSKTGIIVGAIVAGITAVACIIAAVICCNKYKLKKKKTETTNTEKGINMHVQQMENMFKATNHSTKDITMRRVESFPVLLYTHDQIKDFKEKYEDPHLYQRNIPAKPWASLDLLPSTDTENQNDVKNVSSATTICVNSDSTIKYPETDMKKPKS